VKQAIGYWLLAVMVVFVLYTIVSMGFFNHSGPAILGMPPMVFWFTVVPVVTPLILGGLYWIDRIVNPQWDEEEFR
jgi:hypothetical protein